MNTLVDQIEDVLTESTVECFDRLGDRSTHDVAVVIAEWLESEQFHRRTRYCS